MYEINIELPYDYKTIENFILDEEAIFLKKKFSAEITTSCQIQMFDIKDALLNDNEKNIISNLKCDKCYNNIINLFQVPLRYNGVKKFIKEDKKIFVKYKSTRLNGKIQPKKDDNSYYVIDEISNKKPTYEGKFCSTKCLNNFIEEKYLDYNYRDTSILQYLINEKKIN